MFKADHSSRVKSLEDSFVMPVDFLASTDAVILCGGLGTRLRTVVEDRPKAMALVQGRPFLEWMVNKLSQSGIRRIILCVGYLGHLIRNHFGDGNSFGLKIAYSEDTDLQGTAGALRQAYPLLKSDPVLVLNGDSWCEVNLSELLIWHHRSGGVGTLALVPMKEVGRYGHVIIGPDEQVERFEEKGKGKGAGWINAGLYALSREFLLSIPIHGVLSLEHDVFPHWVDKGLYGFRLRNEFVDIGTPESYQEANRIFCGETFL